jgi:membrane associated rhomboid family serine protease
VLFDALLLAGFPLALVGVYLLPTGTKRALALDYLDPEPLTLYTSHLVHFRPSHLGANLLGFALAATAAYLLATAAGDRRRFRVAMTVVLVALPVVLSGLNVLWTRPRIGYGASGVTMAVAGLLPVFAFVYLDAVPRVDATVADAPAVFFAGLAVAGVGGPLGGVGDAVGAAAGLAVVLYAVDVRVPVRALRSLPAGHPELLATAVLLAVGYPLLAFPADPYVTGGVVDLYTHLLGYALAFIAAYLTPGVGLSLPPVAATAGR